MLLYNTKTRRKEVFVPLQRHRVTLYVCGPTVYGYAHIGNARPAVVFDVLARLLRRRYPGLVYVRNITDIDDKINAAALGEGVPIEEITARYTLAYHSDLAALGVCDPDVEPRVTQHMPQIRDMIQRLIDSGHAYEAEAHVLFDVASFPEYGKLSNRDPDEMLAGARVEVAPYKRNPSDFVLWKPSDAETPGWDSPWGRGRPGWHIECSSMIETHLGETIDIHGGGSDLVFPHHENELAQSTCAHGGREFCRYWLHNGFVNVDREKMSKSLGNVLLVRDLLRQAPGEAIRLALLNAHYRAPLDWTDDGLHQARRRLDGLYQALRDTQDLAPLEPLQCHVPASFIEALEDDLNTPVALAELSSLARAANSASDTAQRQRCKTALLAAGEMLGLLQQDPEQWFSGRDSVDPQRIEALLQERDQARREKRYDVADRVREQLEQLGVLIEDRPDGTTRWRLKT